jgi:transcription elongation factor Elf1
MNTIKTKRDSLGAHHFDCPKCKKEGFLGFWQNLIKYPSPMKWSCSHCGEKIQLERTPYKESVTQ